MSETERVPKYKTGDVVRVRAYNDLAKDYSGCEAGWIAMPGNVSFTANMREYCGKKFMIYKPTEYGETVRYFLAPIDTLSIFDIDDWIWTEEMLESADTADLPTFAAPKEVDDEESVREPVPKDDDRARLGVERIEKILGVRHDHPFCVKAYGSGFSDPYVLREDGHIVEYDEPVKCRQMPGNLLRHALLYPEDVAEIINVVYYWRSIKVILDALSDREIGAEYMSLNITGEIGKDFVEFWTGRPEYVESDDMTDGYYVEGDSACLIAKVAYNEKWFENFVPGDLVYIKDGAPYVKVETHINERKENFT